VLERQAAAELPHPPASPAENQPQGETTITEAKDAFLAEAETRYLKPSTIDWHRILFRQLETFAAAEGIRYLKQLDTNKLTKFRASWEGKSALADLKKLERLRSFFKFAQARGYSENNPAAAIRNPKVRQSPTLQFSHEEMLAILAAAAKKIA
jgi:site-specific recombinase XerD